MKKYLTDWEGAVLWLREQDGQKDLVRDCFFDDPIESSAYRYWKSIEWRAVREELPNTKGRALDIGAGRGIASYALARDGWKVTSLEPSPSAVVGAAAIRALNERSNLEIDIVETKAEVLPFDSNYFDVVHCRQVLHHAESLAKMLSEIARVLVPGGYFIATREHVISKSEDLKAFLDSHPLHYLYGGEHAYTLSEYLDAIRAGGIAIDKCLNPWDSEINTYPNSREDVKVKIARKLKFPFPKIIPKFVLSKMGNSMQTPGRLYTFIGHKPTLD